MKDSPIHKFYDKAWYFLSIYYSRDKWAELTSQIMCFYDIRQEQFSNCLVSFSEERGEHIRVALSSPNCIENYQHEISDYFQSYIDANPSFSIKTFPYGRTLWCNYPNNTLVWDRFRILAYTDRHICLHNKTFLLARQLLKNDFSFDNVLSCAIYLVFKGLVCIDPNMQSDVLSDTLNDLSDHFENYNSIESLLQSLIDTIDSREVCEAIEFYWRESSANYSPELIEWLNEVESMNEVEFGYFCLITCNMLGISELKSYLVVKLIDIWLKSSRTTPN